MRTRSARHALGLLAATAALGAGFGMSIPAVAQAGTTTAQPSASVAADADTAAEEGRDLRLINQERPGRGLPALHGLQAELPGYARQHAQDMAAHGRTWHDMPALQQAAPAGWRALGENVAYNTSIEKVHAAYMTSPGHRANILNTSYNWVGIGVWHDAGGYVFNSEEFMGHPQTDLRELSCG